MLMLTLDLETTIITNDLFDHVYKEFTESFLIS